MYRRQTHIYPKPGRYVVAVKVIDIFGNDTMALIPVTVGSVSYTHLMLPTIYSV